MSAPCRAAVLRNAFLQDAAKAIVMASPSTSSYLVSESVQLELAKRSHNEALPNHQRQSFCTACGNVFIPGSNCTVTGAERSTAPDPSKKEPVQRHIIVYRCHACHQRTSIHISPSPRTANSTRQEKDARCKPVPSLDTNCQTLPNLTASIPKTSSKKRAKAREEKAGLQSMLDKSKKETRASPQLNLMDLMMP
jgi:RNase P subunit RPR2